MYRIAEGDREKSSAAATHLSEAQSVRSPGLIMINNNEIRCIRCPLTQRQKLQLQAPKLCDGNPPDLAAHGAAPFTLIDVDHIGWNRCRQKALSIPYDYTLGLITL